jgi:alpha-N-arabinofuranosidase
MANLAQMVNVIAPIMTNAEGYFLQPTFFPLVEFGKQRGNTSLDVYVDAPTYQIGNREPLSYLDVSSTFHPGSRTLFVNVLNRSQGQDLTATVQSQSGDCASEIRVWEMNHPDLKATHTFGDDERVRPTERTMEVDVRDGAFTYTFPAHSLTVLELSMR